MKQEKSLRVLLVEDNPGHAELVKRNLRKHEISIEIIHLKDGEEALNYLFNNGIYEDTNTYPPPHVILLDLRLPKIDGLEILQKVKASKDHENIPVVILTTSNSSQDINNAYKYKVNSYLVKPIDYEDFNALLNHFGFYWFKWNNTPLFPKV